MLINYNFDGFVINRDIKSEIKKSAILDKKNRVENVLVLQ